MGQLNLGIKSFLFAILGFHFLMGFGQHVKNVPEAFKKVSSEPEVIFISNEIKVPTDGGHLQGVQLIEINGTEKLVISGSSLTEAYVLQVDLATRRTETLISLMDTPYRHAGGIQISTPYLAVGIEDNVTKTTSKVCLYNFRNADLHTGQPNLCIDRNGVAKQQTAGSTGLLTMNTDYLMVVSNWDSRNWDFYRINLERSEHKLLTRFNAPDGWASYQSINLIMDTKAIYAIGFYQKERTGYADLILVSKLETFEPIMEKVRTKSFHCKNEVDFSTAAGLQVDTKGNLHIWGTQRDALQRIAVNKFSATE